MYECAYTDPVRFEWDPAKARSNLAKHRVEQLVPSPASTKRTETMRKHHDFSKAKRGPVVPVPKGKSRITIRLDDDVLGWFREQVHAAGGGNYQTLINDALRTYVAERKRPLELVLRRVVREELRRAQGQR